MTRTQDWREKSRRSIDLWVVCTTKKREKDMAWIILKLVFVYRSLFLLFLHYFLMEVDEKTNSDCLSSLSLSFFSSWTNNTQCRISFTHRVFTGICNQKGGEEKSKWFRRGNHVLKEDVMTLRTKRKSEKKESTNTSRTSGTPVVILSLKVTEKTL